MSGFDPSSIALSQDVALSTSRQEQLRGICAAFNELRDEGTPDQALEFLRRARTELEAGADSETTPQDWESRDKRLVVAALSFLSADLQLDQGDVDLALEEVEAALDGGWRTREAFDVAGWANYAAERPALARDHFDRALSRDPDKISSLMGRALALIDLEDFDHARSDLTHAINIDGADAELYALRSDVFVRTNNLGQAERDIQQARDLEDEPEYALQHARLLIVQGRVAEAEEVIDYAVEADEVSLDALLLRSHLHLSGGRISKARADAIRASNNFPDEAFAFVQLAHVQLAAEKANSALKAAERAVELDPSLSDAYMVRGAARHLRGMSEEAREDFDHAHQAPAELPVFLLGPCCEMREGAGFERSLREILAQYTQAAAEPSAAGVNQKGAGERRSGKSTNEKSAEGSGEAGVPPGMPPGMGDFDPMSLLGQVFDDSGKMKKRFKPFLEMAMKNAPSILKKMPPGMLPKVDGFDPSDLEKLDFSQMSSEQIEEQMRQFYEQMQSGENPFDGDSPGSGPAGGGDKKH
jgi:tetratricopeptide (TPR) repeat protein